MPSVVENTIQSNMGSPNKFAGRIQLGADSGDILMEENEFKRLFGGLATAFDFKNAYKGWIMKSNEVTCVLDLQKSNFGNFYYLNMKFFIHGLFGAKHSISKKLVKTDCGDIFLRPSENFKNLFDLESSIQAKEREAGLQDLFESLIAPLALKARTKQGITELYVEKKINILPAIKRALGIA